MLTQIKNLNDNYGESWLEKTDPNKLIDELSNNKECLLEYFFGDTHLYILSVFEQQIDVKVLEMDSTFENTLAFFLTMFQGPANALENVEKYKQAGYWLYQVLFPEQLQNNPKNFNSVILIPDGKLAFLPFEALLTENNLSQGFSNAPFLIKSATLKYLWSSQSYKNKIPFKVNDKNFQFSPEFSNGERDKVPLVYGLSETQHANGFERFIGKMANLDHFLSLAPEANILHLSTHAQADSTSISISFFDEDLPLDQLYTIPLAANLVVISACESHVGSLLKGEGVLSLARGFAYAGAESFIASQWKVNEASTSTIFQGFYEELAKGKTKANALRNAKLSYLSNSNAAFLNSPYYWAGFVYYGSDGPVDLSVRFFSWYWLLSIPVFVLFFIVFFKKSSLRG